MSVLRNLLDAARTEVRETNQSGEVTLCCPFCETKGLSADVNFHLGLNTENGKAHCFRCDWKSSTALYTARQLIRVYDITFDFKERELVSRREEPVQRKDFKLRPTGLPDAYESLTGPLDMAGRRVKKYLEGRGVGLLQIIRHKIGYASTGKYAWRAILPVFGRDGLVYGSVCRGVRKDQEPPYLNTPGIKMLWNTERPAKTAVITEGVMENFTVERALRGEDGAAALARLGSSITPVQIQQLSEYRRIIIFPDFDRPGLKGARELGERLEEEGVRRVSVIVPPGCDGRDPGSMTETEIVRELASAVKWSEGTMHRLRHAETKSLRREL